MARPTRLAYLAGNESAEPLSKRIKFFHEQQQQDVLFVVVEEKEEERPWSDIIDGILEMVAGSMCIGDLIQASRVCRQWRNGMTSAPPEWRRACSYGNACLLSLVGGNTGCALYDPLRKEHFLIATCDLLPGDVYIACSDRGWLLLAADEYGPSDVLFFNPLTRKVVELPKLVSTCLSTFSFSAPPTSPGCVIVAMFPFSELGGTCFNYCRPGDEDWTSVLVKNRGKRFTASTSKPLFFKDRICVLDVHGRLGVFDLFGTQTLTKVIRKPENLRIEENCWDVLNLVEMDGKLMLIYADFREGFLGIYELDESNDRWIEIDHSTGDRRLLLFCSAKSSICVKSAISRGDGGRGEGALVWRKLGNGEVVSYSCSSNQLQDERFEEDLADLDWDSCEWIELEKS